MVDQDNCEHDAPCVPFDGAKHGETECSACGSRFLLCPGCSEDSVLNHAPAIYHAEPLCKATYTAEEFEALWVKSLAQ